MITVPQNPTQPVRNASHGRGRGCFFGYGGGRTGGGRFRRPDAKQTGEIDAYCMSVAPLNIFENQVSQWDYIIFQKYSDLTLLPHESFHQE